MSVVLQLSQVDTENRTMLNFDEQRFLRIQSGAIALQSRLETVIVSSLSAGAENIFFLGTGGAAILMQPAAQLLQRRSRFPTFIDMPAELVLAGSAQLTDKSIVVMPSLSGTTKESVALLSRLKEIGATVITPGRPSGDTARQGRGPRLRQLCRGRHVLRIFLSAVAVHCARDPEPS